MSEYQYYEWQTVDRLLTEAEQDAVGRLSSHIDVSSGRAVVTYSWGDFKHDPRQVLVRFFDAHLYMANWGSRRLMFRFPAGLLNREVIKAYCVRDQITYKTIGRFDVLDLDLSEEEGSDEWIEGEGSLSDLVPLRNDILQGDHRLLYLAWLKAMSLQGDEPPPDPKSSASKHMDPPIPPGLRQLSSALKRFIDQFDVSPDLVAAAAEVSPKLVKEAETDFCSLVAQLSRQECDRFLCRFAQGDTTAGMELEKRLLSLIPSQPTVQAVRLSFGEMLKKANEIEKARQRKREEEARRKHAAEMEALAGREAETWQEVESLVEMKQPKQYETAVQMLAKLKELSEFRDLKADYRQRLNILCERYRNRPGFKWRVQQAKLLE
jgi:hypothetical protein